MTIRSPHPCGSQRYLCCFKEKVGSGYFETLIRTYLLENTHASLVLLLPSKGLTARKDQELKERMAGIKAGLSREEMEKIITDTRELKAYQESEDAREDLEKIPMLTRADMKKEAAGFVNDELKIGDTRLLYHELFTNGIGYLRLIFDLDQIPEEYFPYIGILKGTLGLLNTEHYSYGDLFNETNIVTGGMSAVNNFYGRVEDPGKYHVTLELKTKVLYENIPTAIRLMEEIVLTSDFTDEKRLKEILAEGKSRMQAQMISAGHSVAAGRALSYGNAAGKVNEILSGLDFYRLICDLDAHFEEKKEELKEKLLTLAKMTFRPENLMVDFVGTKEGKELLSAPVQTLKEKLYTCEVKKERYVPKAEKLNEGLKTSGQVQYVCRQVTS